MYVYNEWLTGSKGSHINSCSRSDLLAFIFLILVLFFPIVRINLYLNTQHITDFALLREHQTTKIKQKKMYQMNALVDWWLCLAQWYLFFISLHFFYFHFVSCWYEIMKSINRSADSMQYLCHCIESRAGNEFFRHRQNSYHSYEEVHYWTSTSGMIRAVSG